MSKVLDKAVMANSAPNYGFAAFPLSDLEVNDVYNHSEAVYVKASITPVDTGKTVKVLFSDEQIVTDPKWEDFMEDVGESGIEFKPGVQCLRDKNGMMRFSLK